MSKMTHGEIRGLLLLIALMAIVVVYAWLFTGRGDVGNNENLAADSVSHSAVSKRYDSLAVEVEAAQAAARDSLRAAHGEHPSLRSQIKPREAKKRRHHPPLAPRRSPLDNPL